MIVLQPNFFAIGFLQLDRGGAKRLAAKPNEAYNLIEKALNGTGDMTKRALIVVDVQNDFCPGGSLAVTGGDEVVAPLNLLIREFLDRGDPVYLTRDWHPAKTKHFAGYGGTWPIHCVRGTFGAEFHSELLQDSRIKIISKGIDESADGYSGFDGTNLADDLRAERVEEVWVGGLATDYCVKQTVLDARREGFRVRALADAMRPVNINPDDGAKAIDEMRSAGAEIVGNAALGAGSTDCLKCADLSGR